MLSPGVSAFKNNQSFGLAAGMLEIMTANRLCPAWLSIEKVTVHQSRFANRLIGWIHKTNLNFDL